MTQRSNILIITLAFGATCLPTLLLAADPEFIPLVGIPFVEPNSQSTGEYVEALYKLSIGLAAFLAVIKIIFAGVQYMLSEIVTDKGQAKKDIQGALLGLLIIVGAVTLLNEINPDLKKLDFIKDAEKYGRVVPYTPGPTPILTSVAGYETLNYNEASPYERQEFTSSCTGQVKIIGGEMRCLGAENNNATVNTTENFNQLYTSSGLSLTGSDKNTLKLEYNQYIANREPAAPRSTENILQELGGDKVLFQVDNTTGTQALSGYRGKQENLCTKLGGQSFSSLSGGGNISACVK